MPKNKTYTVRAAAVETLLQVLTRGRSLTQALKAMQIQLKKQQEGALLQEMCYGVCRWYYRLDVILSQLLKKPMKEKDQDVFCLLLLGLYQLEYMRIPEHAVVKETVDVVNHLRKSWARGLVNALLREYQRERDQLQELFNEDLEGRYAHPQWMIDRLRTDWPEQYQQVLEANNQRPPMVLRVNPKHATAAQYVDRLADKGIDACVHPQVGTAVELVQALPVHELPGFDQGHVSVQDAAAQLAAPLLDVQAGMRVLDACAAPGGKTLHIIESVDGQLDITALDIDAGRVEQISENLERCHYQASLKVGDAAQSDDWWDGRPFERILLDVPCSGSGVIRRHPDIKLLRQAEDIDSLTERQAGILDSVWPLLSQGGILIYVTCSVFRAENEAQISAFLRRQTDARELPIEADWGQSVSAGCQVLPGQQGMDGFFFARLEKIRQ